jgi:hypothetical protein
VRLSFFLYFPILRFSKEAHKADVAMEKDAKATDWYENTLIFLTTLTRKQTLNNAINQSKNNIKTVEAKKNTRSPNS